MTRDRTALCSVLAAALAAAMVLGSTAPADAQKRGGTLTIVRPTDPVSLDPQLETTAPGAWVYFNMLEPLLTIDEKMQIRPSLASSYEVMSPTKVRFKLRPGVKFHDGTPLNAAAVNVIFERNPDYWGDKALLDRVIFKVVPEEGARMIALQTGDADMVLLPAPAQLPQLKRDPRYVVHEVVGGRVVFAGMNAAVPPLDDVRVRTALLHAVDRKAILENILEGSAVAARGVLAPSVFGFKDMQLDRLYPFDRAKAKALLARPA